MKFPLFSVQGARLVAQTGDESIFYEYLPPDLEQKDADGRDGLLSRLEADLRFVDFGPWLKLYKLADRCYLNCAKAEVFGEAELLEHLRPLPTYFQASYPSNVDFHEDYLVLGGQYWRVLTLRRPPSVLSDDLMGEMEDYVLCLSRFGALKAKSKLDMGRRLHFSNQFKGIRDIDSENAYIESEALLEDVSKGDKALFRAELFFLCKVNSKLELDHKTSVLAQRLRSLDAEMIVEGEALAYLFRALIPGVAPTF